jgi:phenylacetate-CoA ligase
VRCEVAEGVNINDPKFVNLLSQKIKNTIGLSMKIQLESIGSIPRSQGGKLSRIVDRRN